MITKEEIVKPENLVYEKTSLMTDKALSYCPGCGHGTAHRIIMEVIEELGLEENTIGVAPVGCSVLAYEFMNIDMQQAAHGRAPAVATGIKRPGPGKLYLPIRATVTLQPLAQRKQFMPATVVKTFVIVFVNNGIYGMTGGQMAPTTLPGMKSSTSPYGRDVEVNG
jgi:2-oxoglutarate/2-oxoacid ferredoxin oxidoreductase subunit beta